MQISNSLKVFRSLFLAAVLFAVPFISEAKIYLVSVGVADYPGSENDLRLPANDAATVRWVYKENKNAQTVMLTNSQATVSNVKKALNKLSAVATTNDIVVFFFSGHGVKGSFVCVDGYLKYKDVAKALSACNCKNKMVFADACFSGAIRDSKKASSNQVDWDHNIMLFLSCRSDEYSIETDEMTNGFFTYALQHGLRGAADANRDKTITARELFNYVSSKVKEDSDNQQHPVMWGRFPDTMPVMRW